MATGTGVYFDGRTSARREVAVEAAPDALRISAPDGTLLAEWPYPELIAQSAPDDCFGSAASAARCWRGSKCATRRSLPRSTICPQHRPLRRDRTARPQQVVAWTFAATVSLVFIAVVLLPAIAERLAPLIPLSVEHRMGVAVDAQVRAMLDTEKSGRPFECGLEGREIAGRAALDKLIGRLETAAALPIPLKAAVVRRKEANAIALPGGTFMSSRA